MYEDVPFDVFDDPDRIEDPFAALYKEGSQDRPVDAATANYYVGRIKQNKAKLKQYEEQAKEMKDNFKVRVDTWLQTRQKSLDFDTQHCMDMLEMYYEQNKPANGKPISLPEGNIGMYAVSEKYDFDSCKDDVIRCLVDAGMLRFIRTKPEINKTELKKACSVKDGKVYVEDVELPKVSYTPKTTAFNVR